MSKAPRGEYIVPQFSSHISSAPGVYERWKARVAARPVYTDTDRDVEGYEHRIQSRSISMSEEVKKEYTKLELQIEAEDRGDGSSFVVLSAIDGKFSTENGIVNGHFQIGHIGASIAIHFNTPTRRTVVIKTEKILEAVAKKLFPDVEV